MKYQISKFGGIKISQFGGIKIYFKKVYIISLSIGNLAIHHQSHD